MAWLNLSWLKINNTPLDKEETPISQDTTKIEQVIETKPTSSFTLSLSSLIGWDSWFQADSITNPNIESSLVVESKNEEESIPNINIDLSWTTNSDINIEKTDSQIFNLTGINIDSNEIDDQTADFVQISSEDKKEEISSVPVEEETKEFFKNFNVIDVFSENKELLPDIQNWETTNIINLWWAEKVVSIEESPVIVPTEQLTEPATETDSIQLIQEENINNKDLLPEIAEIETLWTEETVNLENISETIAIDETIEVAENTETQANQAEVIDKLKKDLSWERKPGWISIFKKKAFIFSFLWVFIIAWAVFGLTWLWWDDIKSNINETTKPVNHEKPKPVIKTAEFKEWLDYSIQKNKKKNIKKTKLILENTGSIEQSSTWIENSTWNVILENSALDLVNPSAQDLSWNISPENIPSSESWSIIIWTGSNENVLENSVSPEINNLSWSSVTQ